MQLRTLDYVVFVVDDLDRALGFFCEVLGLPLSHQAEAYAQLDAGTTRLSLFLHSAIADTPGAAVGRPTGDLVPDQRRRNVERRGGPSPLTAKSSPLPLSRANDGAVITSR